MKRSFKIIAVILVIAMSFSFMGAAKASRVYSKAQDKMTDGDYEKAAELFDSISTYEDSSVLAMYCKACLLGEQGKYEEAVNAFTSLGDLKDCPYFAVYYSAVSLESQGEKDTSKYAEAAELYAAITLFKDSSAREEACRQTVYDLAGRLYDEGEFASAYDDYELIIGYKDSAARMEDCVYADNDVKYNAAIGLMDEGDYSGAIRAFEKILNHRDSADKIEECETAILYADAVALMESGKYESAIAAFTELGAYKDSADMITETKYQQVASLMQSGDYESAYALFSGIRGYKDVDSLLQNDKNLFAVPFKTIGNTVTFGRCEQDNDISNGREDIEWTVLATEGDRSLIISRYALDCKPYNSKWTDEPWETCSLRKWLNSDFFNTAFSAEEQAKIATTKVKAEKNPKYDTDPGDDTEDKVFLLSINEAMNYFSSNEARRCAPTAYAEAQGAWTSNSYKTASGEAACLWWLRSPGINSYCAARVYYVGSVSYDGDYFHSDDDCVRPALWINLES